ncbi:hypothetical protein ACJX0J_014503, partial [Zea mays]
GGLGGGALWDEDTFVISLEEGHYAAYIKMMVLKYMIDEDVDLFNGMKEHLGSTMLEALILSDVTDLPTHHLCCFVVFGSRCYLLFCSIQIFTSPNSDGLYLLFCHFSAVYNVCIYKCHVFTSIIYLQVLSD